MRFDPATAVGKPLDLWGRRGTIIGAVKVFHFKPIHRTIDPLIIRLNTYGGFVVCTQPCTTKATIREL